MWSIKLRYRKQWSSFEIIILGFAGVILAGALLLMLPVASREGNVTPFTETLFTATSAACVTGLAVRDTGSYWSVFGQSVILLLIQIGGLGVVTIAVSIAMLSGRKISLMQRSTMQDAISAPKEPLELNCWGRCFFCLFFYGITAEKESGWRCFILYPHSAMQDLIFLEKRIICIRP